MKLHLTTLLAGAALVATVAISAEAARTSDRAASDPFVTNVNARSFTVSGTVVSARGQTLVVRIDDHGHHVPFALGSGISLGKLKAGTRVSVRYHPNGATGQVADDVQVLGRS
jgi:hypothetical protein